MNIFIAGSAKNNIPNKYLEESKEVLNLIFKENNDLVFGSGKEGIMGIAYEMARKYKRKITAISAKDEGKNLEKIKADVKIFEKSLVLRGKKIIESSDIIVIFPGGIGTFLELLMALDMKRSGEIDKKILIYNISSYFEEYIKQIDKMVNENFVDSNIKNIFKICNNKEELLNNINR